MLGFRSNCSAFWRTTANPLFRPYDLAGLALPKALTDPGPQDQNLAGSEPAFLNPPPTDVNGINKAAGEYYHLVYNNVFGPANDVRERRHCDALELDMPAAQPGQQRAGQCAGRDRPGFLQRQI